MAYALTIREKLAALDMEEEVAAAAEESGLHLNNKPDTGYGVDVSAKTPYTANPTPPESAAYLWHTYILQPLLGHIADKTGIN